jgi:hypothetical protein
VPVAVALVVSVMPPPEDVAVSDEDELDVEDDCDDENEEIDEFDDEVVDEVTEPGLPGVPETTTAPRLAAAPNDELPRDNEAGLIAFNTPCQQKIAANCPDENPEIET